MKYKLALKCKCGSIYHVDQNLSANPFWLDFQLCPHCGVDKESFSPIKMEWVETGLDDDTLQGIYELYFDRRVYLVSDTPATPTYAT